MTLRKATPEEIKYVKDCRNAVKGVNFSLLYGAGMKTVASTLRSAAPSLSKEEATALAKKLLLQKKGIKKEGVFIGGCDAPIYNSLNKMADDANARLPALGTRISSALRRDAVGDKFITARANFNIQASGAEMLSVIVTIIAAFIKKYNINAHYVVSIHDELAYLVKDEDVDDFCALMNLAHFYTWSFFHEKFGITEFPWARAFFDDINVRHCLCKEAYENVTTVSNPVEEPAGKQVTIKDLIANGNFESLHARLK